MTYQGVLNKKRRIIRSANENSVFPRKKDQIPIWNKPYFADLFTKPYFEDENTSSKFQSVENVRQSLRVVRDSLFRLVTDRESFLETRYSTMVAKALELFDSGLEIFDRFPNRSADLERFYSFIDFFMGRVRGLPIGGVMLVPVGWLTDTGVAKTNYEKATGGGDKGVANSTAGTECSAVLVLHRHKGSEGKDFNVTIINTNNVPGSGFEYHAVQVDPTDGSLLYNLSFELRNLENERVYNTSFWLLLFKSGVFSNVKFGSKWIYERVLPYLTTMPVTHMISNDNDRMDFFPLPVGGDKSGIILFYYCFFELVLTLFICLIIRSLVDFFTFYIEVE